VNVELCLEKIEEVLQGLISTKTLTVLFVIYSMVGTLAKEPAHRK
jgi:hypothetical protein